MALPRDAVRLPRWRAAWVPKLGARVVTDASTLDETLRRFPTLLAECALLRPELRCFVVRKRLDAIQTEYWHISKKEMREE